MAADLRRVVNATTKRKAAFTHTLTPSLFTQANAMVGRTVAAESRRVVNSVGGKDTGRGSS